MLTTQTLWAQRTEFKFKRGNAPIDYTTLSITPVIYHPFGGHTSVIYNVYSGISGVYYWVNLNDSSRTYVGSSVNIGSRMESYNEIMRGYKAPKTAAEKEFANTSPLSWGLVILDVCSPSEARVLEQLAILHFLPSMNTSHVVKNVPVPGLTTHAEGVSLAISLASQFAVYPQLSAVFSDMADRLIGYDQALQSNVANGVVDGTPVWIYQVSNPGTPVLVYGSLTRAKSQLRMRYSTLLAHANDKVLAKGNTIAISFTPLTPSQVLSYTSVDLSMVRVNTRNEVQMFDANGVFVKSVSSTTVAAPMLNVSRSHLDKTLKCELNLKGRNYQYEGQIVYLIKATHLRNP